MDSNTVTISMSEPPSCSITDITYIANSLRVTPGQNHYDAPQIQPPEPGNNLWSITLMADRQGSGPVAQSFNAAAGGPSHVFPTETTIDTSPDQLNFYFGVNLTAKAPDGSSGTITVYLGQGHTRAHNNWWFGSQALSFASPNAGVAIGDTVFSLGSGHGIRLSWRVGNKLADAAQIVERTTEMHSVRERDGDRARNIAYLDRAVLQLHAQGSSFQTPSLRMSLHWAGSTSP